MPRLALGLALLASCCSGPPPRPALDEASYPGELQPPAALGYGVQWRQRVTAVWADGERSFPAVVVAHDGLLRVVGLSPLDEPGFVIDLAADGSITVDSHRDLELPFPARFILLDVQRTFFPWLERPGGAAGGSGTVTGRREGERIREVWRDGRVVERVFRRLAGQPAGAIRVTYEYGDPSRRAPARAVLDNGWLGYRLLVDTLDEQLLDASTASPGAGVSGVRPRTPSAPWRGSPPVTPRPRRPPLARTGTSDGSR